MNNNFVINEGMKTYELKSPQGKDLGTISFNPSDVNIMERHRKAMENIERAKATFALKNKNKKVSIYKELEELDKIVHENIDYIVNAEVSKEFFSIMGAFSPLESGQFFFEHVLDIIYKIVEQETGERSVKIEKRIQKHTEKYHK